MAELRLVERADIEPHGWVCEGCGRPFLLGDLAYGEWTAMIEDTPLIENWVCGKCRNEDR